jgi:hypothetical protein
LVFRAGSNDHRPLPGEVAVEAIRRRENPMARENEGKLSGVAPVVRPLDVKPNTYLDSVMPFPGAF